MLGMTIGWWQAMVFVLAMSANISQDGHNTLFAALRGDFKPPEVTNGNP